ncbi:hypothetical protein CTheo_6586 [Ceratobasidium theobromae]|uniref:Fungal-type protein kinase domain-containing protein n=1 Tax=Ceratobasidium theobromae TaxID=1582974 RepID=A0A5N5QEM3_9AGAM|nr:hypothetical protein CTheo_6586 [Ceratobasidium theobromae]
MPHSSAGRLRTNATGFMTFNLSQLEGPGRDDERKPSSHWYHLSSASERQEQYSTGSPSNSPSPSAPRPDTMSGNSENKSNAGRCSSTTSPVQPHAFVSSPSQSVSSTSASDSEVTDDSHEHAQMLHNKSEKRKDMEEALCAEINGAVFEYALFCDEFLAIEGDECTNLPEDQSQAKAQERHTAIMKVLADEPVFNHERQPWTIDCTGLKGDEDDQPRDTVAKILDTISKATFERDQFRPVHETVRPFGKSMNAEDPGDTIIQPDIVQVCMDSKGHSHWAEMEFFAECKAKPEQLHEALLQLAIYARATLVHQIYRLHVFAIAVCGTEATFVRLGRSGILHSPPIDLSKDFETFARCAAGLFALSPERFGYNTDFYFWPKLTEEDRKEPSKDREPKELRVKAGNRIWRVVDVLCQRKYLVGRATLVLLLSRVKNRKQRVVMKLIWRDELQTDEGENMKLFEGYHGICQCKWNEIRGSTSVEKKECLKPSSTAHHFFAPWSQAESEVSQSDSTDVSLGTKAHSDAAIGGAREQGRKGMFTPEDRELSLIIMEEGIGIWRIKRLPHLLRVLRDTLVGFAGITSKGKIHRDISEGNILCAPPVDDSVGKDTEPWSENKATLLDLDSEEDTSPVGDDPDLMFNKMDLQPEGGKIDAKTLDNYVRQRYGTDERLCNLPLMSEEGGVNTPMSDGQVSQQFGPVKCLGRLCDLEFMMDQIQSESCSATRTGTREFIAGQLLCSTLDQPVPHTYLHDLESFFWVLVWMMVTYTESGKQMNCVAFRLFNKLRTIHPGALGDFKGNFLSHPKASAKKIGMLENGWGSKPARDLISFFAKFLKNSIYEGDDDEDEDSCDITSPPALRKYGKDQWPDIKSVIDGFDIAISQLPIS